MTDPFSGLEVTVHLALDDAGGDSAIVEYVDGRPQIHHDSSFNVMTNSPPFEEQLEHLKQFAGSAARRRYLGPRRRPTASCAPPTTSNACPIPTQAVRPSPRSSA